MKTLTAAAEPTGRASGSRHEHWPMALSNQRALPASDTEATPKSCGWGRVQPECLQSLRTPPWALATFCSAGFIQGLAINGYIPVVLPTIERRFQMRSIQAGSIVSMYNVGSLLCSTPVAYFGNRQHKPRYMAIGTIVMATGSFIFAIPHFLVPPYQSSDIKDLCPNLLKSEEFCATSPTNLPEYRYFFMLGNFLHGCGTSPFYTLGIAYLDDNVPTKTSPVYLGIYFAMALLGPAVGFLSGGYFLSLYTDITKDPKEVKLNRFSKVWVGAWWMGFLVAAGLAFLAAIPIFALPKELPGYRSVRAIKKNEVDKNLQSKIMEVKHEHFLGIIAMLLSNRPYVLLTMAGTLEAMMASGLSAFISKILEAQFGLTSSASATILGIIAMPSACGGTLIGGYVIEKFDLVCSNIIRMCLVSAMFTWISMAFILLHCTNVPFAGISNVEGTESSLKMKCNENCSCSEMLYSPICGADNVTYFSPCFAGCRKDYVVRDTVVYSDCSCISSRLREEPGDSGTVSQAELTRCQTTCNAIVPFSVGLFLALFGTFLNTAPGMSATIRCVGEPSKSVALGLQWVSVRLFGTIVSPILFGSMIDLSCVHWQTLCQSQRGACLVYENASMSYNMYGFLIFLKTLSVIFFFAAWLSYRPAAQGAAPYTPGLAPVALQKPESVGKAPTRPLAPSK